MFSDEEFNMKPEGDFSERPPVPKMRKQRARRHEHWRLQNFLMIRRAMRNMTQAQLADKVGVSVQTISAIENRRHEPVMSLGIAIAEALDAKVEDVFRLIRPTLNPYDKRKR